MAAEKTVARDGSESFSTERALPLWLGDKYKRCCFLKGFHCYQDDETGDVIRSVPLNAEARGELDKALAAQREKFIAKFGREPGPDDPIFFDLDEDKLRDDTANAMRAAGIRVTEHEDQYLMTPAPMDTALGMVSDHGVDAPILITGATGNVGGATAALLRERGVPTRPPSRVEFDFDRPETFGQTFAGVRHMLLVRPPAISQARRLRPALEAAREAGVRHVVFLSLLGVERNPIVPHFRIERLIRSLGFEFTFLRPSFFMQNLSTTHADEIRTDHEIIVPAGHGATSFIDVRDIAAVAAKALSEPGHEQRAYPLTGAEALTYHDVAQIMTEELGYQVTYRNPSMLRFLRRRRACGEAWSFIAVMLGIYGVAKLGRAGTITDDLTRLLGRPAITFAQFVRDYRRAWC